MTAINYSTTEYEKLIFQRKRLQNLKRVKLDIRTFNVLMSFDGKRSVGDISRVDMYDQTFLEEKIQLLLKLHLIEPVTNFEKRTTLNAFGQPIMNSDQPAKGFEIKQITNKQNSSPAKLMGLRKAPLIWCVAGCGLAALLLTSVPIAMKRLKSDATASLPPPALELDAGDERATKSSNVESKTSKTDRAQSNGQGRSAVQSTALSDAVSPTPFKAPVVQRAEDQPKEIEVALHKNVKDEPVHSEPVKTKPLSAKVPGGPLAQKSVTAPLVKSKRPSESLNKKPPTSKLPHLTVKKITSKTRPASEAEFLHYLDQTGPGSNWKEILLHAARLWRLEAPMVEKYAHFSNYLENYHKYGKLNRLAIHSAICTLHQLKVFNMPAILAFRHPRQEVTKFLVIKSIDYQNAVLSNGKSKGDIIITHHQLERFWSGISHIPWKKVIGSADVINTKSQPEAVKELKAYLNSVGFHNLGDPEMYNQSTASAIKQIQTRFGITPTGVVDVTTHAAFNRYRDRIHSQAGPRHKT
jgi:hypothetical protein